MYQKSRTGWLKHYDFLILDIICMQVSFFLAYILRHGLSNPFDSNLYRNEALILFICQFLILIITDSLKNVLKRGMYIEFVSLLKYDFFVMIALILFFYLTKTSIEYSRFVFIMTGFLFLIICYLVRIFWKNVAIRRERELNKKRSMVLVTKTNMVESIVNKLSANGYSEYAVSGLILMDADMVGKKFKDISVVGKAEDLTGYICHEWVDEVFICLPENERLTKEQLSEFLRMGVTVHDNITKVENVGAKTQCIEKIGSFTVLTTSVNIVSEKMLFYKRCLDIIGGLAGCVITCILFLFVAPAIYIKSPGPIFFTQWRVGRNGRRFKIYKFRSMYLDAEERKKELMEKNKIKDGMMFKLEYDPRIIGSEKIGKDGKPKGIGNFIRKTSIDEFPQFFNVLKGDMSLVGTRPPTLDEWEKYELHHRARMAIKPGITGAWQTSGRSEITDFEEVVRLDTEYIENWTNGRDIKIILKTIKSVIKNEGAM